MMENMEDKSSLMNIMPPELLFKIFDELSVKYLLSCRRVNHKWKNVVDKILKKDDMWKKSCETDFTQCQLARLRASPTRSGFRMYRSLNSWKKVEQANESKSTLIQSNRVNDTVINISLVNHYTLAVHTKSRLEYYDLRSEQRQPTLQIFAFNKKYMETPEIIALLTREWNLQIYVKTDTEIQSPEKTCFSVINFTMKESDLYYFNFDNKFYHCNLKNMQEDSFIGVINDMVESMGVTDGLLNVLTEKRFIYRQVEGKLTRVYKITPLTNLLHQLDVNNFFPDMDFEVYLTWMGHTMKSTDLHSITSVSRWGDVFFVGCNFGVLLIYYKPFTNGKLDIYKCRPIKRLALMDPKFSTSYYPILKVEVKEIEDGHQLFIAFPNKVIILKLTYRYKNKSCLLVKRFKHGEYALYEQNKYKFPNPERDSDED